MLSKHLVNKIISRWKGLWNGIAAWARGRLEREGEQVLEGPTAWGRGPGAFPLGSWFAFLIQGEWRGPTLALCTMESTVFSFLVTGPSSLYLNSIWKVAERDLSHKAVLICWEQRP